ncbi:hypothetical protein GZH47_15560 [Paenibacillus rhizovicinus]|uniref:Copper amine oxidase-like N-terminal domain-containing protein n=1 Tax=Paenibacillus rhizovicinus TaxID=2704463 RepID=A0A6C0P0V2_9BACL|nr:hypothetical protein [Paenibacillus rhizovicinus]QHW32089.1 hypothetical protein GZH47_15560 [Paenibacillus rhizovicinus]
MSRPVLGTTYLPVRAVSDAFEADHDNASRTISIGAGDAVKFNSSGIKPKYKPWQFEDVVERSQLTFGDTSYDGAYSMPAWSGSKPNDYMSFQFDGKYQKLHLVVSGQTDLKFQVADLLKSEPANSCLDRFYPRTSCPRS